MKNYQYPKIFIICSLLVAVLFIESCSSGKKALKRGDYYLSVLKSVDRLRRKDNHKILLTLRSSYPLALEYYENNITNLLSRNDLNKWGGVFDSYGIINNMYEEIRTSPGALRVIPNPKNYYAELDEARNNAAEESYQFGLIELDKGTREGARSAYLAFQDANGYVNGYRDVVQKMEDAYWLGTVKVLIEPIPVAFGRSQLDARFFEDKIHENLKARPIGQFVRFLTENELDEIGFPADHILEMQFIDFAIGEVHTKEKQIQQVKDSVVVATVKSSLINGNMQTQTQEATDPAKDTQESTNDTNNEIRYVDICHRLSDGTTRTITIAESDLVDHSRHGDQIGPCTESTSAPTNTTPATSSDNNTDSKSNSSGNSDGNNNTLEINNSQSPSNSGNPGVTTDGNTKDSSNANTISNPSTDPNNNTNTISGQNGTLKTVPIPVGTGTTTTPASIPKPISVKENNDSNTNPDEEQVTNPKEEPVTNPNPDEEPVTNPEKKTKEKEDVKSDEKGFRVIVCHKASNGKYFDLSVPKSALQAHFNHGDQIGSCNDEAIKEKLHNKEKPKKVQEKKPETENSENVKPKKEIKEKTKEDNNKIAFSTYSQSSFGPPNNLTASLSDEPSVLIVFEKQSATDTVDVNVYGTVKATVYIFEKNLVSRGTLSLRILEAATGAVISADRIATEYIWSSQWGYYNGDERALTEEQLTIIKQKEVPPPNDQQLFYGFTEPIMQQLLVQIQSFYRNY